MLIEELSPGQEITLLVTSGEDKLEFTTNISETYPKKRLVLADPIYRNEKVLSFKGKNLLIHVLVSLPDTPPIIFKNVTVSLMKKPDDTLCYSLATLAEGKPFNRRENFRCYVGVNSSVQCGVGTLAYDTIIRDVSCTGFSITCDFRQIFQEGQVLHVVLNDYIEEIAENFSFHLYGIIVRIQELENGKIVYGCRLNNKVIGIDNYIAKKERIRLRTENGLR